MNTIARTALIATMAWPAFLAGAPAAAQTRDQARASQRTELHRELDALGAKIDRFEARSRRENAEIRARMDVQVKALRADKADAERALRQWETAGESAGKDLDRGFQRAFKKLKDGYRRASEEAPWTKK